MLSASLPAISGKQLIKLFDRAGRPRLREAPHGVVFGWHDANGTYRFTTIPNKSKPLPPGTLSGILRQSGLGRSGLLKLLAKPCWEA